MYVLLVESMPLGMLLVFFLWDKMLTDGERPMFAGKEACFQGDCARILQQQFPRVTSTGYRSLPCSTEL